MINAKITVLTAFWLAVFVFVGSQQARANTITYGFYRITDNSSVNPENQFTVEVAPTGNDSVSFTFRNAVGIPCSITGVYFNDGLFGAPSIESSTGVSFSGQNPPNNLPGGKKASPPFVTSTQFTAGAQGTDGGVNAGTEWVTLTFGLGEYETFEAVIDALDNPKEQWHLNNEGKVISDGSALRIGLHVQSIGADDGSDSFVNGGRRVPPAPVPDGGATMLILALGMLGLGYFGAHKT